MLVDLIRFIKGYVVFRVVGKSPERLLNITSHRGVMLWNAQPGADGLEASVCIAEYRSVRQCARKAGVRTVILQKHGLPFWAARYRGRTGILIGAAIGAALLVFLSQFIWTVSIGETVHVSEARLRGLLADSGVRAGVLRHAVDTAQAQRHILLQVEELSWLSVNIVGSHVRVEVKEKVPKPGLEPNARPCNLKAAADGVITDMQIGDGITQVKTGSGVRKGDLLVSGVQLTAQNKVRYICAKGKVMADVRADKDFFVPQKDWRTTVTETASRHFCLDVMGARLPCSLSLTHFDSAVCSEQTNRLTVNDVALPLGVVTETTRGRQAVSSVLTENEAKKRLQKEVLLWELFEKGEGRRVSKQLAFDAGPAGFTCHARCVFNGNIAESVDFSVEGEYN